MNHENKIEDDIYHVGFHVIDNFLTPEHFHSLVAIAKSLFGNGQFKNAKIGRQQNASYNETVRTDQICWIDENENEPAINAYLTQMNAIANTLNRSLFLGLVDFETHFAIYQPGSFYKKHVDQFTTTQERRISCVFYLNEHWEESYAGQLQLYDRHDQSLSSIMPTGNRLVCFSSDLPHEVCETKQTRYSLTGWMKTRTLSGY